MTTQAVLHYYRQFRRRDGDPLAVPALAAWNSARSHVAFRQRLSDDIAAYKRRSKAAKKAWKARKASTL
jgi:hypothetical protein